MLKKKIFGFVAVGMLGVFLSACGGENQTNGQSVSTGGNTEGTELSGQVSIDGSTTVFPIMEAVSEEFKAVYPNVKAPIGTSGTGGGFKLFTAGSTDLSNASRLIKDEEKALAEQNGIAYEVFEMAYDGITVVVNKQNTWTTDLTVEDLKKLFIEDGTTKKWSDINPQWPNEEVKFFTPGVDSGTHDYFNEVILEDAELVKTAQLSADPNVIATGVAGEKNAIGFFGYSYFEENADLLNAVRVNGIAPSNETIENGTYTPLSRSLYVYVNKASVQEKPQVYEYMKFALENAGDLAEETGYVRMPQEKYDEQLTKLENLKS